MKVHTTAFKEQIKEMGRELDSIITYGDTVLGNEQLNAVTPSFQGGLLKSVMKQLDIDSNVPIPVGTILNYKFGVKVNEEYEYLNFGNYVVKDVEKQEDTMSYKITCYDKLLFSMKDYAKMPITYPITIRSYINTLCSFLGIRFANNNDTFVNYNKTMPNELYLDANGNSIGYTFRDVLDELAQVTASTICLNDNDELEIRYINDTGDTIDEEFLKNVNVNFGERYGKVNSIVLSRSGESDNVYLRDEASVSTNGLTELKIVDNQIMNFNNRDEFLPEILGKLNGLEYYLNDFASTGVAYYDLCDRYNVKVGDNTYSCIMFNNEMLVTQGLEENIFTEMPQETETDYTKADKTDRKINQTYIIVDKQNQQIEAVVSQTDEQNQKIAKVTQTVDELNSKISDIADITISGEDTDAQVELDNINQSEPIRLVIRPIGESISYDYPHEDYPQEDFSKIRTIRFTNTKTEEVFDYILPMDLLYYDSEHYDEFILDYEGQTCMVNKRVGYNDDGTTYVLDSEQIIECDEYPRILLTEGDYKVQVLGYDTAYIFVRLMAQNIYTTQFYTKAETDSIISQTSQSIDLSVNKKLSNYSTTAEMNAQIQLTANGINQTVSQKIGKDEVVSSINQSAEEVRITGNRFVVEANNFKLDKYGNMESTSGKIGGFSIGEKELYSHHVGTYTYTTNDTTKIRNYILGTYQLTNAEKILYDVNGDGKVDALDYARITKAINNGNPTMSGTIELSSESVYSMVRIKDKNGNIVTEIGMNGFDTTAGLSAATISCDGAIGTNGLSSDNGDIRVGINESGNPLIRLSSSSGTVHCVSVNQTSLEENKKNIEKFENALPILKNIDIHKYNYKLEKDNHKKHLGFVIGKKYNYSSEITSIDENGNENGVDLYSMTSLCLQAIKEQQEIIEQLKQEINLLKESER